MDPHVGGAAATPLRPGDVFGGWVLWIGAREVMNATIFIVVATLLGAVLSPWACSPCPRRRSWAWRSERR